MTGVKYLVAFTVLYAKGNFTSRAPERRMPRTYANSIVEMDASAAGHIARWDPARVLAEVDAKRHILEYAETSHERAKTGPAPGDGAWFLAVRLLALAYAGQPGYREEWRP